VSIGLQLAVLPLFVHHQLNYSPVLAGLAVSTQYVATLLSRPQAGRMGDTAGPKTTVLYGLLSGGISGVLLLFSAWSVRTPLLSLGLLLIGRLILGFGESWAATGASTWGMGRVGVENTAQVISWAGIASNGGLAIGAPLGVWMEKEFGLPSIAFLVSGLNFTGFLIATIIPRVTPAHGRRLPFGSVLKNVFPYGMNLALGTVGFGTIASFITLYYANRHWPNAALSLTLFGTAFVTARLLFSNSISRWGGFPIALLSLGIECAGLICLWLAPVHAAALVATAITGFGFALVFPSLGVEAIRSVSPSNSGAALGIYTAFLDLSLGLTGPLAGVIASSFGFGAIYLWAAISVFAGMAVTVWLWKQRKRKQILKAASSS
jgi:predicted MFS family arabinose efflux permease